MSIESADLSPADNGQPNSELPPLDASADGRFADVQSADETTSAAVELLRTPRDGTPAPLTTPEQLAEAVAGLAAGIGPVAVDAERASGYRYSQRAYLVQLRRTGYPTVLIDPIALPDLRSVDEALIDAEWILHAANQDLPCLAELGLRPRTLFDSELVGRLLGSERVALATMLEQYLGKTLEKGHSAADWSTRPLPESWLAYAALDVELLIELREVLLGALAEHDKLHWAVQECESVRTAEASPPRAEPWRRLSGIHALRSRRQLAVARSLWSARDRMAAGRDLAPGRILPDSAVIAAVKANPESVGALLAVPVFNGPRQRRQAHFWFEAIAAGQAVPDAELPELTAGNRDPDVMPPSARWREREPAAAARLAVCRDAIAEIAERRQVVPQNLLSGETIRRLAWQPVVPLTIEAVREQLAKFGAREWQVDEVAHGLTSALLIAESLLTAD